MKTLQNCIIFCSITLFTISCAPSPENVSQYADSGNNIALGFYHGLIIIFSLLGQLLGFDIGIFDTSKDNLSYWLGYGFALSFYIRIINFFWVQLRTSKQ